MKEFRTFEFKVSKAESEKDIGFIEGYASTFGNVDLGEDVVDQGAFQKTIVDKKGIFPILLDHYSTKQIGWNLKASEDSYGLRVQGEIQLVTEEAKNRYMLAKRAVELDAKMGLSIGYTTVKWEADFVNPRIRHLKEVKLWEYSMVTFPMNEMASITGAKSQWAPLFEQLQKSGYTVFQIKNALAALGLDQPDLQAATRTLEPELLHSVDNLIQAIRA
jgi:HK97 family phage prohead protease